MTCSCFVRLPLALFSSAASLQLPCDYFQQSCCTLLPARGQHGFASTVIMMKGGTYAAATFVSPLTAAVLRRDVYGQTKYGCVGLQALLLRSNCGAKVVILVTSDICPRNMTCLTTLPCQAPVWALHGMGFKVEQLWASDLCPNAKSVIECNGAQHGLEHSFLRCATPL